MYVLKKTMFIDFELKCFQFISLDIPTNRRECLHKTITNDNQTVKKNKATIYEKI